MHRKFSTTKNYLAHNVNNAEAEKPYLGFGGKVEFLQAKNGSCKRDERQIDARLHLKIIWSEDSDGT